MLGPRLQNPPADSLDLNDTHLPGDPSRFASDVHESICLPQNANSTMLLSIANLWLVNSSVVIGSSRVQVTLSVYFAPRKGIYRLLDQASSSKKLGQRSRAATKTLVCATAISLNLRAFGISGRFVLGTFLKKNNSILWDGSRTARS